jgi:hypothetical protein
MLKEEFDEPKLKVLSKARSRAGLSLKFFGDGHYSFFGLVLWVGPVFLVRMVPDAGKGVILVGSQNMVSAVKKVFPEPS